MTLEIRNLAQGTGWTAHPVDTAAERNSTTMTTPDLTIDINANHQDALEWVLAEWDALTGGDSDPTLYDIRTDLADLCHRITTALAN